MRCLVSPCGELPGRKPVKKFLFADQSYVLDLEFVLLPVGKKMYILCITSLVCVWTTLLSTVTAGFLKVNNSL